MEVDVVCSRNIVLGINRRFQRKLSYQREKFKEQYVTTVIENYETTCWGCGLRLLLPSCASIFKCGWCGAITNQNKQKCDDNYLRWRRLRDRCFVSVVIVFMLFVIFGGLWAVYPYIFSVSLLFGVFHSIITTILAVATISFFSFASLRCAGTPPTIVWGSYPTIGKGDLEDYTFCNYCSKPKSPGTHHCRSCGKCIMDMDHHCPFIGNCVGAANHRHFIAFLISAVISTIYVSVMSAYAGLHIWPPLTYSLGRFNRVTRNLAWRVMNKRANTLCYRDCRPFGWSILTKDNLHSYTRTPEHIQGMEMSNRSERLTLASFELKSFPFGRGPATKRATTQLVFV